MKDETKADKDAGARKSEPRGRRFDPEDDVTSELSDLIRRAFGDSRPDSSGDTRVTGAHLVSSRQSADETLPPGFVLNERFEIVELVHTGGMSHVYKAIDRRRHCEDSGQFFVAVKMLRQAVSKRQDARDLLEREASKARSLSHPNIINIFDFDEQDDHFFLVMEWLEGESLNAILKRAKDQPLSRAFSRAVIEGVAAALEHSHQNKVVHADINPSNIFVTATHDIKLLDFGVARSATEDDSSAGDQTAWVTQSYASPEVLSGRIPIVQDDVFSLACVAYRMFSGRHPFHGRPSILARRDEQPLESIPGLPDAEWSILARALAYSRSGRPESVDVFFERREETQIDAELPPAPTPEILRWGLPIVAAVAAALAVVWWSRPDVATTVPATTTIETPDDAAMLPAQPVTEPASATDTATDRLLAAADEAMQAGRLIAPESDNARDTYREILLTDPGRPEALQGLRAISDRLVERASAALDGGDPQAAAADLTFAAETDPGNPAVGMLEEVMSTRGEALITSARVAAANGNIVQAETALRDAMLYPGVDPAAIETISTRLSALERERELAVGLSAVDSLMSEGRLLEPQEGNAVAEFVLLRESYGETPATTATAERLTQRLLTEAALASAAGEMTDAGNYVAAAASLGVLDAEVERAQALLAEAAVAAEAAAAEPDARAGDAIADPALEADTSADEAPGDVEALQTSAVMAGADSAQETTDDVAAVADEVTEAAGIVDSEMPSTADASTTGLDEADVTGPVPLAAVAAPNAADAIESLMPSSGTAAGEQAATPADPPIVSVEDLGLVQYVAPSYPRGAKRRGVTGHVDLTFDVMPDGTTAAIEVTEGVPAEVFDDSAVRAIRQWRFEPRQDSIRGSITLRFEIED